jgi:tRNA (pseudouridine54-N1)-methyltransferase
MRRFVVIGQRATASPDFLLDDLPSTSKRLDVLLRCLRAALMVSHGLRRDTVVYLVLLGGPRAPRALRVDGAEVRFLRPDERSLAMMVQKSLARPCDDGGFTPLRAGVAMANGGLDTVLADLGPATPYILEERARDLRDVAIEAPSPVFFVGDHLGFDEATRARLAGIGAAAVGVGPVSVHADDAIAIVSNELDRREAGARLLAAEGDRRTR